MIVSSLVALTFVGAGIMSHETVVVRYTDVTGPSGLHFQHHNSATPSKFLIETMTGGVAVLDYDGDGWLDVFFVNGAKLKENQTDGDPLDKAVSQ